MSNRTVKTKGLGIVTEHDDNNIRMLNIIFNFFKSFLAVPFDAVLIYITATNTGMYRSLGTIESNHYK